MCQGGQCIIPVCSQLAVYCAENSLAGIRVRESCASTCGCNDPASPLALSRPEMGCSSSCTGTDVGGIPYWTALASMPCVDLSPTEGVFAAFLDSSYVIAQAWPQTSRTRTQTAVAAFKAYGCAAVKLHYSLKSFCAEDSGPVPLWPLIYFCPVACGCSGGSKHCPGLCPA
eukprot:6517307-Prymnesium_polylepis.1